MKIETLAQHCINAFNKGNKIFVCGNGGSATMSNHFCTELIGKFKVNRKALPAISLCNDITTITAVANDFGYEHIFTRQLEALSKKGDVLICLSTSGRSKNVLEAIGWGKGHNLIVCDFERIGDTTTEIQENQMCALHELAGMIEVHFI